jgi:hypothetical protein
VVYAAEYARHKTAVSQPGSDLRSGSYWKDMLNGLAGVRCSEEDCLGEPQKSLSRDHKVFLVVVMSVRAERIFSLETISTGIDKHRWQPTRWQTYVYNRREIVYRKSLDNEGGLID